MKTNNRSNTSEVRAEQVTKDATTTVLPETIYLGVDLHKASITITRIIEHSTPQPGQKFTWDKFWVFMQKQTTLSKKVYAVYEAGAFGFWAARKLKAMGIECFVVHPEKLDPQHKRVQTDKLDSRHLADKLQRYVLGNKRAMVAVYVPTEAEEQQRLESRHREAWSKRSGPSNGGERVCCWARGSFKPTVGGKNRPGRSLPAAYAPNWKRL